MFLSCSLPEIDTQVEWSAYILSRDTYVFACVRCILLEAFDDVGSNALGSLKTCTEGYGKISAYCGNQQQRTSTHTNTLLILT